MGFTQIFDEAIRGREFNLPMAYNAVADKASWDEGLAFLAEAFRAK